MKQYFLLFSSLIISYGPITNNGDQPQQLSNNSNSNPQDLAIISNNQKFQDTWSNKEEVQDTLSNKEESQDTWSNNDPSMINTITNHKEIKLSDKSQQSIYEHKLKIMVFKNSIWKFCYIFNMLFIVTLEIMALLSCYYNQYNLQKFYKIIDHYKNYFNGFFILFYGTLMIIYSKYCEFSAIEWIVFVLLNGLLPLGFILFAINRSWNSNGSVRENPLGINKKPKTPIITSHKYNSYNSHNNLDHLMGKGYDFQANSYSFNHRKPVVAMIIDHQKICYDNNNLTDKLNNEYCIQTNPIIKNSQEKIINSKKLMGNIDKKVCQWNINEDNNNSEYSPINNKQLNNIPLHTIDETFNDSQSFIIDQSYFHNKDLRKNPNNLFTIDEISNDSPSFIPDQSYFHNKDLKKNSNNLFTIDEKSNDSPSFKEEKLYIDKIFNIPNPMNMSIVNKDQVKIIKKKKLINKNPIICPVKNKKRLFSSSYNPRKIFGEINPYIFPSKIKHLSSNLDMD